MSGVGVAKAAATGYQIGGPLLGKLALVTKTSITVAQMQGRKDSYSPRN